MAMIEDKIELFHNISNIDTFISLPSLSQTSSPTTILSSSNSLASASSSFSLSSSSISSVVSESPLLTPFTPLRIDEDDYTPYNERIETYVVPIVFGIIFIVGVLGNGTLVIIFLRHRAMRNIPNTYILSLSLADLLVIFICVPLASIVYTFESWPWGSTLCRVTECAKDISIGVSVFTLTALSAERYCAIVNPLRKLQTRPLTVFTAIIIWLLAILCATPSAIVSDAIPAVLNNITNHSIIFCTPFGPDRPNKERYTRYTVIGKAFIYYIIPLITIGALYVLMAKRLHLSAREMPGELSGTQSRTQARARRHVARMVVTFVIVFFVCFFPHHLFALWFHLNPNARDEYDEFWHVVRIVGFCFSFLNSCVNPVALYCVSGVFRQHFHRYLCCRQIPQPNRLTHHSSATTGVCDTSFMSVRRTTSHSYHYSLHGNTTNNNNDGSNNSGGIGVAGNLMFSRNNNSHNITNTNNSKNLLHRQQSLQLQKFNPITATTTAKPGINNINNSRGISKLSPTTSTTTTTSHKQATNSNIIISEKR